MWFRITFMIRYFQLPGDICDKYYKTVFYLRLALIKDCFELICIVLVMIAGMLKTIAEYLKTSPPASHPVFQPIPGSVAVPGSVVETTSARLAIDNIPGIKFDSDMHTDITMCKKEFAKGDGITKLPCDNRHYAHVNCAVFWIKLSNKAPCSVCQKDAAQELANTQRQNEVRYRLDANPDYV
eukprot:TRINITY_DN343_c0_g1_i14.p1 TRINITY_DN343_c0_g1~~TRINITY_DN343_c0_g1_i14.p1  ORF type:complete len:182 (-),score=12.20 TRINITY_DN343_c0_g1_i14:141-686(-)